MAALVQLWRVGWRGIVPILLAIGGKLMTSCCCSSSSSSSSSSSGGGYAGEGYYCILYWDSGISCAALVCDNAGMNCQYIGSQAQWDSWQFDVCIESGGLYYKYTTPGVRHDTEYACNSACTCP